MECTYSIPKTYDGSTPASMVEYWQYSHQSCTYSNDATISARVVNASEFPTSSNSAVASTSGNIDIANNSNIALGLSNEFFIVNLLLALIAGALFWKLGSWLFD